jgi:uncharacterized membrane protein
MTVQRTRVVKSRNAMRRAWGWIVRHEAEQPPHAMNVGGHVSLALTALMALVYASAMSLYMIGRNATFATHAEDLGIMDQVLWNTSHGRFMLQTICNSVTDVNCFGASSPTAISRFAIHFEPILIPLSLLYLIWPSVNAILILQAVVVASGALPVWLLAARRLRNAWWGLAFAALFLAYPPLIAALTDDFHPETLAATILLWACYFLTARRYRALLICLGLALLCKETMTLDVMAIGAFVALVHQRRRLGLGIVAAGALTLLLALALMRLTSPLGYSPVSGRITYLFPALARDPLSTVHTLWSNASRWAYLVKLLAPYGFLPLLAPWMAALALPAIMLNALSSNAAMYSAQYQYNTDIAAVFIVAAIDAVVWIAPLTIWLFGALRARLTDLGAPPQLVALAQPWVALVVILLPALVAGLGPQTTRLYQQVTVRHNWPTPTAHDLLGDAIANQIPASASVSAQSTMAPHVSQRARIYQFPSGAASTDYVFLDVTGGDYYPFSSPAGYVQAAMSAVHSGGYDVVAARDGYLLLRRAPGAEPASLPPSFYSFTYASSLAGAHAVDVRFAGGLELVGYSVNPPQVSVTQPELTVTTYWRVSAPLTAPQTIVVTLTPPNGGGRLVFDDSLAQEWLPPSQWRPGQTIVAQTWPIYLDTDVVGDYILGVEVRDGAPGAHPPVSQHVQAQVLTPADASGLPATASDGRSALLTRVSLD